MYWTENKSLTATQIPTCEHRAFSVDSNWVKLHCNSHALTSVSHFHPATFHVQKLISVFLAHKLGVQFPDEKGKLYVNRAPHGRNRACKVDSAFTTNLVKEYQWEWQREMKGCLCPLCTWNWSSWYICVIASIKIPSWQHQKQWLSSVSCLFFFSSPLLQWDA